MRQRGPHAGAGDRAGLGHQHPTPRRDAQILCERDAVDLICLRELRDSQLEPPWTLLKASIKVECIKYTHTHRHRPEISLSRAPVGAKKLNVGR